MEFIKLENSDLQVSRFCVGCMSFGDPASKTHDWTLDPGKARRSSSERWSWAALNNKEAHV